jgi:hypothetical protein
MVTPNEKGTPLYGKSVSIQENNEMLVVPFESASKNDGEKLIMVEE